MKHIYGIFLKSVRYLMAIVMVTLLFTVTASCSNDKREAAISYVLKQIYQAPDPELINLSDKMSKEIDNASKSGTEYNLENSEFFISLAKQYEDYMTEEYYEKLLSRRIPYQYHLLMTELGYVMNVQDIDITKNDNNAEAYDFVVKLSFEPKEGESNNLEIQGSAQFENDSNRINYLNLLEDNLTKKLTELNASMK